MGKVHVAVSKRYNIIGYHPDSKVVKKFTKQIDKRKNFSYGVMEEDDLNGCWLIDERNYTTFDFNEKFREYVSVRDAEFSKALARINYLSQFIKLSEREEYLVDDLDCLENELNEFSYTFPSDEEYCFEDDTNKLTVKTFLNTLVRTK